MALRGEAVDPDDAALLACIREGRTPAQGFDHRQHLRAAWLYLQAQPFDEACRSFCADLKAFATTLGAPQMYHHTLSIAALQVLASHGDPEGLPFERLLERHPALLTEFRELIGRHYSPECLATDTARQAFVAPDRTPLPEPGTFRSDSGPRRV